MATATPPAPQDGRHSLGTPRPDADRRVADRLCRQCGYGVAAGRRPFACPMCGGRSWRSMRPAG